MTICLAQEILSMTIRIRGFRLRTQKSAAYLCDYLGGVQRRRENSICRLLASPIDMPG
jgi:hypothetical protein